MTSLDTLADAGVSEREAEVLDLVAQRATNAEIAARLFVSVRTVESHVSSLLRKLGVADRRALARLVHERTAGPDASSRASSGERRPGEEPGRARPVPVPLTSFVGRSAEVAELTSALHAHRLVTAAGPGGVGKTRLAAAVAAGLAAERRDGVWFVDLVPVTDGELVATAVANTLGLGDVQGRSGDDAVIDHLAGREALLVLDNCEHVADAVGVFVERVLGRCPEVTVLATSQARLMLPFEWVFPVPGLSLPADPRAGNPDSGSPDSGSPDSGTSEGGTPAGVGPDDGEPDDAPAAPRSDAVALFVERARQAGAGDLAADSPGRIGEICRRLDGSALAIELAAARLPSLGLDGIERGLSERFRLLAGGSRVDERHSSLRSAIDWSYALLAPVDQALLRRVSVFASSFAADEAAAVAGFGPVDGATVADGLARLAEHSLLVASPADAGTRYRALESIRQYGMAQMASAPTELDDTRRRHLAWAAGTMGDLDRRAELPLLSALDRADDLAGWRQDFDRAADDARAALKWAMHRPDLRLQAFALAGVLGTTCFTRGLLGESQHRYAQAAEVAPDTTTRVEMLMCAGGAASSRQAGNDSLRLWRTAADTARAAGDRGAAVLALAASAELLLRGPGIIAEKPPEGTHAALLDEARSLGSTDPRAEAAVLIAASFELGETDPEARATAEKAIAAGRSLDDPLIESAALDALTTVHLGVGDVDAAVCAVRRRIDLVSPVRPGVLNAFEIADAYNMATEVSLAAGDFTAARRFADTLALLPFHSIEGHLATSRRMRVEALAGELDRVLADGERFRRGWEWAGRPVNGSLASGAYAMAMAHGLRGDDEARDEWLRITVDLGLDRSRLDGCYTGYGPTFDAIVALHHGRAAEAMDRLAEDPGGFTTWNTGEWRPWYAALHAEAAVLVGHESAAGRVERARAMVAANPTAVLLVERAAALLAGDTDRLVPLAADLASTGCRYQRARTLVLAGGAAAVEGRLAMAELGAAPMAEA